MPKGIPNPNATFGWEIDRDTPDWPASWLAGTPSATAGYYYIDKTAIGATNTANTYGHPGLPRTTPPEGTLAAGAFIYIHAGDYTPTNSGGDRWNWNGVGTSEAPIWITGNPSSRPTFSDLCHIGGGGHTAFLIFENFEVWGLANAGITVRPDVDGTNVHHILVRNNVRTGTQASGDNGGIGVGLSSTTDSIPNSTITDIVIWNNEISNCGVVATTDHAGVYVSYHTNRVWVLDNVIHGCGGDGIAGSHYSNYTTKLTENYYIGRNTTYGNGENGIDLKNVNGFVISENHIYGPFEREQGWGIVLHYGALTEFRCRNGWVIFNRIHHVSGGIYTGSSSGCDNLQIVGNLIYDVDSAYAASPDAQNGFAIMIGGSDGTFRIADNTFHDCESGINLLSLSGADRVKIHGNIFSDVAGYAVKTVNGQESLVSLDYNLYEGTPTFFWANASRSLAYMQATALQEAHAVSGAPNFVDAATGDFHVNVGSPAINVSVEGPAGDTIYNAFETAWGLDTRQDFYGGSRPVGAWDIGAAEYGSETVVITPVISPVAGTYATTQSVTITCATGGAAIHYTMNGDTPTILSPVYSGAFDVATDLTVKAIATKALLTNSAVASAVYDINADAVPDAPTNLRMV